MENCTVVAHHDTIRKTVNLINSTSASGGIPGIAVVTDNRGLTLGVVTDGDIRQAFCQDLNFDSSVDSIMSTNFVFTYKDLSRQEQLSMISEQFNISDRRFDPRVSKVVVCDRDKKFVDIIKIIKVTAGVYVGQYDLQFILIKL